MKLPDLSSKILIHNKPRYWNNSMSTTWYWQSKCLKKWSTIYRAEHSKKQSTLGSCQNATHASCCFVYFSITVLTKKVGKYNSVDIRLNSIKHLFTLGDLYFIFLDKLNSLVYLLFSKLTTGASRVPVSFIYKTLIFIYKTLICIKYSIT